MAGKLLRQTAIRLMSFESALLAKYIRRWMMVKIFKLRDAAPKVISTYSARIGRGEHNE